MNFLKKLDYLMEQKHINKNILSKESGVPYTTIDGFYKKGYSNAKIPTIRKLADYFDTTLDYLIRDEITDVNYGKTQSYSKNAQNSSYSISIADTDRERSLITGFRQLTTHGKQMVECVLQKELELQNDSKPQIVTALYHKLYYDFPVSAGTGEYLDDSTATIVQLEIEPPRGTDYILRISGDSMEPEYCNGDYVYVRRTSSVEYGDIGIFIYAGNVYMKKYTPEGLKSLNPNYALIRGHEDMRCLGRVLGVVEGEVIK